MTGARPLVCIVGPTASGKSAVADRVALILGGAVVSVDAMQIYRGMDIGTAKTPVSERLRPLHMVDICPVDENYSVERFQKDARACIDGLVAAGIAPVLCGGTGLYLNAVIDTMDFAAGHRGDERRERYEARAQLEGPEALYRELEERDPRSAAAIHPNNVRRVIRALELCDDGSSYAASLQTLHERGAYYQAAIYGLQIPRDVLYRRIDARVDAMFEAGLVQEVVRLMDEGLDPASTAGQAIGYKEVIAALRGELTLDEAREAVKTNTRRYAKRQISWFKHDGRVRWLDAHALGTPALAEIIAQEAGHGAL